MDKQVFELLYDINCENEEWSIWYSDGSLLLSVEFGDTEDKMIPEGDYISIWLKPSESGEFIERHKDLCWYIVPEHLVSPDYCCYIYKV